MKIQLLHPPTLVSPGSLQTARPTPPLGLAFIAATLRQAGHDCTVIDAIAEAPTRVTPWAHGILQLGLPAAEIVARVDADTEVLGVTCMFSFNWPGLREILKAVRASRPELVIVCGGEHFTGLAELCMQQAPIDFVVLGEGEEIVTRLVTDMQVARNGGAALDPAAIRGIAWRDGDRIVVNPRADRMTAIDAIPWPAWDLFDLDAYNRHQLVGGVQFGGTTKTIPILATRGCPYQCTYCSSPRMWTTRWTTRDPVDVADEVEDYHRRFGANNFPFQDLTMIIQKDWVVRFCQELIRRELDVRWQLPSGTRCEVIDDEVADLLNRSGCRWLGYAPESGSERTRGLIKKKMKRESLLGAVEAGVRHDLHLSAFFVIGFPHDTEEDLRGSQQLVRDLARRGVEDIAVHYFFPIPSTELFESLRARGRIGFDDRSLLMPLLGMHPKLGADRNFCDHLDHLRLTRWKLRLIANFYFTAWLTHPTRPFRILRNAWRQDSSSSLEYFLADRFRKLRERRKARGVPAFLRVGPAAPPSGGPGDVAPADVAG